MKNRTIVSIGILISLLSGGASLLAGQPAVKHLPSSGIPEPPPQLGTVAVNGVVKFEDVEKLSPEMAQALALLRARRFQEAASAFEAAETRAQSDPLIYRGEAEAARGLHQLDALVRRLSTILQHVLLRSPEDRRLAAALNFGIGEALMLRHYNPVFVGDDPIDLGPAPKEHFLAAIAEDPRQLLAHLGLATYYEHRSQHAYTAARQQYDEALRLRPDIYQIRLNHAETWDRPGVLLNEASLIARGFTIGLDEKRRPENAIRECLSIIKDYPDYAAPYLQISKDYAYPIRNQAKAKEYRTLYDAVVKQHPDSGQ